VKPYVESATINGQYFRNGSTTGWPVKLEQETLPASGNGIMELEEIIHPASESVATLDDVPADIVPYGFVPAAGEIAVSRSLGLIKYNLAADGGKELKFTFTPAGTRITAGKMVALTPIAPVTSVNGYTGDVELTAEDIFYPSAGQSVAEQFGTVYTQISGKQGASDNLTSLSGMAGSGIVVKSATSTFVNRSLAVGADLSVSNANGVSGNPTISLGSNVAKKNVDNSFSVLQQLLAGALIAGLNLPGEQIYATAGNLVHNVVLTDVIFSCWTTGANTINLNLPDLATVPFGHILLIFNVSSMTTGVVLNTFNGSQHINGSGISPVTSLALGTGDTQLYLLIADPVIRWRIFQLV